VQGELWILTAHIQTLGIFDKTFGSSLSKRIPVAAFFIITKTTNKLPDLVNSAQNKTSQD